MLFLKHFRHYYLKYAFAFLFGVLILVAVDWYQLEIPRILKTIIDGVDEGIILKISDIYPSIITFLIIVVSITIGRFLWRILLIGTSRKIEADIRQEMFIKATKLDQEFYSQQKIGGLMAYYINDLQAVRELYGFGLLMLVDGLVLGIFVLFKMFSLNYIMTLYAFIPMAIMGVLVFFLELRMEKKYKVRQEAFENMSDFTQESFSGITIIKAYVREMAEVLGFKKKSQEVYEQSMNHLRYVIIVDVIIEVMINSVILAILAYGAILIAYGGLTGGELTEYISYFFTLLWPIFAISGFMNINGQAQASAKRIYAYLETQPKVVERPSISTHGLSGGIILNNLTFAYPDGEEPILKNLSFHIHPGEVIGILGKTGSGKSTLVELLLNVYNVDKNMIFYDKTDINDLSLFELREQIGYVPQDNFLFSESIQNNIGFAYESLAIDQVIEVAKLADLHHNVTEFPEQYATILGERGVTVSGGQKQRISIARALAKNPPILILDDSVSAVDTATEEAIISNLRQIRKGKTTLVIAHRISTVKKLDKILVLDRGQLVGFGTHRQLLKSNKVYIEMVRLQELEALVEG